MTVWSNIAGAFTRSFGFSTPFREKNTYDAGCDWNPPLRSTDGDVIGARPYIEARIKDLCQTDGFLSGAVEAHVNHVVGNGLVLSSKPDWEALGMSEEAAQDFSDMLEREFNKYANSSRNYIDAGRKNNWAKLCAQAYRSYLIHGEILAVPKFGRNQRWNTSVMLIDPNRMRDPRSWDRGKDIYRGGVKLDRNGAPLSYTIWKHNPLDGPNTRLPGRPDDDYEEVAPYGKTGRKRVLHHFDPIGPEQTRGISLFAPVIEALKRQHDLSEATLRAATYQTLIAAIIKSDLNYEQAMAVIGGKGTYLDGVKQYLNSHAAFYNQQKIPLEGLKAIHLLPNEDLELKTAGAINSEYAEFAKSMNREAARGAQLQMESYTGDYAGLSFSGGMLSSGETERGHIGRRMRVMAPFCQDVFELWAEEFFIKNPGKLPAGIDFWSYRDEICRAQWIGPPPIMADPEKIAKASEKRLTNMVSTLEHEAAQIGMDWRELLKQRKREQDMFDNLDLRNPKLEEVAMYQEDSEEDIGDGDK